MKAVHASNAWRKFPWLRILVSLVTIIMTLVFSASNSIAQVKFKIPIVYTDSIFVGGLDPTDTTGLTFSGTYVDTLWFGYHTQATICRDTLSGFTTHWTLADTGVIMEELLPPISPGGQDVRFIPFDVRQGCFNDGSRAEIRQYTGPGQRDSLRFKTTPNPDMQLFHREVLRWPTVLSQYFDSCRIRNLGGAVINVEMTLQDHATSLLFNASQTPSHNFRIVPSGPKVPPPPVATVTLLSPPDGAINLPLSDTLKWQAVAGAQWYSVAIARDSLFSGPGFNSELLVPGGTTSIHITGLVQGATYYWRVAVFTNSGVSYYQIPPRTFTCQSTTDVNDPPVRHAHDFALIQNYPNPFNPTTTIDFELATPAFVTLNIFNVLGQEVAALLEHQLISEGVHHAKFDASTLPSGVYYYKVVAAEVRDNGVTFIDVKKMALVR